MLSFIFVIVCGLFEWRRMFNVRLSFVYNCIADGDPNTKRGGLGPINRFTLPHVGTCSKPGPEFTTSSVVLFFYVEWVEVRGDCPVYWYWCNCSPSLLKKNLIIPKGNQNPWIENVSCLFYMFNELRWEAIVRFIDIGVFVHHHC